MYMQEYRNIQSSRTVNHLTSSFWFARLQEFMFKKLKDNLYRRALPKFPTNFGIFSN
jgi:hypothetical protein